MDTPSWLYKEVALGSVTPSRLLETEKLASGLTAGTAGLMVGTALASPILAAAGAKGAEKMMDSIDRMTFDRDLKKVLDVNKDIGKPNDKQIRLAYQSIRTTNPKFSKDPLIAGTLLRQIMQNKVNPYDPKSPARVDLNIASQLQGAAGRGSSDFVMQAAAQSLGNLPSAMLEAHGTMQDAAAKKEEADRRFDLSVKQYNQKATQHRDNLKRKDIQILQSEFDKDIGHHSGMKKGKKRRMTTRRGGKSYYERRNEIMKSASSPLTQFLMTKNAGARRVSRLMDSVKKVEQRLAKQPYSNELTAKLEALQGALSKATNKYSRRMQGPGGANIQRFEQATPVGMSPARAGGIRGTLKAMAVDAPRAMASQINYNRKAGVPLRSNIGLTQSGAQNIARNVARQGRR